jgi:hypothetical protein
LVHLRLTVSILLKDTDLEVVEAAAHEVDPMLHYSHEAGEHVLQVAHKAKSIEVAFH